MSGRERGFPKPVPWVDGLVPATHGAFHEPAGIDGPATEQLKAVLDFSANGNVIGPPPGVRAAIASVDVSRYPDPEARELRAAVARREGVPVECVAVGNGSTELIWAVARAYLGPGDAAIVLGPTYGEYAVASAATGAATHVVASLDESAVRETSLKVVWLCHPNNPTGAPFPVDCLPDLLTAAPEALFVVDEAYLSLCGGVESAVPLISTGRLAVLRSMTKDMALAGLRIGALLAASSIVDVVRRVTPPWSVSGVAQAAGIVACDDHQHLERARVAVAESRAHLAAGLQALDLDPLPSVANFVLVSVGDASAVTRALLDRGCAVRDCTSFGLPDCIRIGVRSIVDQDLLLGALRDVLRELGRA